MPSTNIQGCSRYTGQIAIPELGLYQYKARVYSPTLGRFLQTDPIGYEDQVNLYAYVGNDPVNLKDPTGNAGVLGFVAGFSFDVATQVLLEGKDLEDVDLVDASIAGVAGATGYGLVNVVQKGYKAKKTKEKIEKARRAARSLERSRKSKAGKSKAHTEARKMAVDLPKARQEVEIAVAAAGAVGAGKKITQAAVEPEITPDEIVVIGKKKGFFDRLLECFGLCS